MSDDVKSKISALEDELYSKDFKQHKIEDILPPKEITGVPSWDSKEDEESRLKEEAASQKHNLMIKKFVKFSIGFFVLAVCVAVFVWWRGSNIVSGENIFIEIDKPVAVSGGETFETKFMIKNSNKVAIESATLFVEYPAGFYSVTNNAELPRMSKKLGQILPGQSIDETVSTILYGEENTSKEVDVVLEYRMTGSNATLRKSTTYSVKISTSPINISLAIPNEVSSGQDIEFTIDIGSNSKDPVPALIVDAMYPPGFTFQSALPAPTYGTNTWRIPGLKPQEKQTIKIRGVMEGQEGEEKITKISIGTESAKDERQIGIMYNAATESSIVTRPFLALELAVNNNKSQNNVASLGKGVRVDVIWQSNNPVKITDVVFEVKLKGAALDKYSIFATNGGYYRSIDNTIVWDKTGNQDLASIDPGAKGAVSFSFSPIALGIDAMRLIKNPQILFEVRARGAKLGDTGPENLSTFLSRSVKFETELRFSAKGLYFSGPFQNIGPMPPKADRETTYTISLSARNSANNVSNTSMKTTLPMYVKWMSKVYPEGEDITFDENRGEVTWNVGRIPAGGSRDASFQISFLPSISHIRQTPLLTGDFSIIATDDFTKTEVSDKKPALTTYISSDPQFSSNDANVVQ